MKFAIASAVIVATCSLCACNDLDVYSGLNFDFDKPRNVPGLSDYERPDYYTKIRYPYENAPPEGYEDDRIRGTRPRFSTIQNKLQQYKQVIDWELNQLHKSRQREEPSPALRYYLDKLRQPRIQLNVPRIDEARMYPPDDELSDEDDDVEGIDSIFDDSTAGGDYGSGGRTINDPPTPMKHQLHSNEDDNSPQFTTTRFQDIKVAADPSEFAYKPSDPRFYRKTETSTTTTDNPPVLTTTPKLYGTVDLETEPLFVNSRSDPQQSLGEKLYQEQSSRDGGIQVVPVQPGLAEGDTAGVYIIAIVAGISAAATVGLIAVGIGWYNLQKHVKNPSDGDYPTYGVTGPNKDVSPTGDRRLAQSAQMYHYQHQKQQVIAMERAPPGEGHGSVSDAESDEENEEGDYTVYECPGLAPTGEMEVKNPLFQDDTTPAQTPATKTNEDEEKK
ncbi:unnamed protein product [Phyllotreta striolata]|uniref:Neural proliferation differentiation and control protein 1 n=1 Tax=Phyllotreta striolata TaxID=444603 RepID=A0A9N9XLX3_PHYSR|nr:unnamed protein product [Phyllotreta striolata]